MDIRETARRTGTYIKILNHMSNVKIILLYIYLLLVLKHQIFALI